MGTDHASSVPPEARPPASGCVQLLSAIHASLGCPAAELRGRAAVIRAAVGVALDAGPDISYPHLCRIIERGPQLGDVE